MSHQQYLQKLDAVAALVNRLSQTAKVRAFLQAPAKAHKGLPRRPVVGTAVSIRCARLWAVCRGMFGRARRRPPGAGWRGGGSRHARGVPWGSAEKAWQSAAPAHCYPTHCYTTLPVLLQAGP